jgi:hypothetical protein
MYQYLKVKTNPKPNPLVHHLKKNGKLRLVHDFQPLNAVSIKDAGLPLSLADLTGGSAGRQIYSMFDIYIWGFDVRKFHPVRRDLITFHCPPGLLQLTALTMGYTNSPSEIQRCMVFVDNPIGGPKTRNPNKNGYPRRFKQNPGILQFVWEHANDVH